jgi:hypothetical protein
MLARLKAALARWYVTWLARPGGAHDKVARIEPNQKCPACGNRDGNRIQWEPQLEWPAETQRKPGAIVCWCKACQAYWFKPPLVPSELWSVPLPAPPAEVVKEHAEKER